MIAGLIEEMVTGLGYSVAGVARTVAEALEEFAQLDFDAVLLDIGLDEGSNPEAANFLLKRGIPFAFVSGYEHVTERLHAHVPLVVKPFSDEQIGAVLVRLVGPGRVYTDVEGADSTTPITTPSEPTLKASNRAPLSTIVEVRSEDHHWILSPHVFKKLLENFLWASIDTLQSVIHHSSRPGRRSPTPI
jgi:CheY-like chemotaxis protein